ncbi:MAG: glutaredoxin family protein [Candidatus Paceibacterota bacterium]
MNKSVTIYSTPTCHFCHAAKDFFQANNIEFTEHDVAADAEKREEMVAMTGQMGVPVIKIGDDIVVGFDEAKVKELIESSNE